MSKLIKRIHSDAQAFYKSMVWEFKSILKDKAVFVSFIGVAVLVSFLYTYIYSNETLPAINIGVVDLDNNTHSRQFLRMTTSSGYLKIQGKYTDINEAKKAFEKEDLLGIVVIPKDFSRDLQRGSQPTVSIYADASYILYYKQIATATQKAALYMGAGVKLKKDMAKGKLRQEAMPSIQPVSGKTVSLYNPSSGYGTFLIPVVLVIIFQTTMLTAIGILGGTMIEDKKIVSFYPNTQNFLGSLPIVMGKATVYLIFGLTILIIMLGMVMPLFNIPMRSSLLEVIVFMIPFLLSVVYLGIFLISFFRKREDAIMLIMFTSIPALLISGFSWPEMTIPTWISSLSYLIPSTLGARGFVSLTQMGASLQTIQDTWLQMWGLCIFYLILAILSLKRVYLIEKGNSK